MFATLWPPGAKEIAGVGVGQVQLDAQVGGAAEAAAHVVPGEAALEAMGTAAGGRLPVDHAALVVLRQAAGGFLEHGAGGVAPAFDAPRGGEVREKVGAVGRALGELAGHVDDVVFEGFEKVGGGDLGRAEAGVGGAGGRRGGNGVGHQHEQQRNENGTYGGVSQDQAEGRDRHNYRDLVPSRRNVTDRDTRIVGVQGVAGRG